MSILSPTIRRASWIRAVVIGALSCSLFGCDKSSESAPEPPGAQPMGAMERPAAQDPPAVQGVQPPSAQHQADPARPGSPEGSPTPSPAAPAAPQGEAISDAQLDEFAQAFVKAMEVQKDLEQKLSSVESGAEAQALQQAAVSEMREKVQATGIDFETYASIAQRLRADPQLQKRLDQKLEAMSGS